MVTTLPYYAPLLRWRHSIVVPRIARVVSLAKIRILFKSPVKNEPAGISNDHHYVLRGQVIFYWPVLLYAPISMTVLLDHPHRIDFYHRAYDWFPRLVLDHRAQVAPYRRVGFRIVSRIGRS